MAIPRIFIFSDYLSCKRAKILLIMTCQIIKKPDQYNPAISFFGLKLCILFCVLKSCPQGFQVEFYHVFPFACKYVSNRFFKRLIF